MNNGNAPIAAVSFMTLFLSPVYMIARMEKRSLHIARLARIVPTKKVFGSALTRISGKIGNGFCDE